MKLFIGDKGFDIFPGSVSDTLTLEGAGFSTSMPLLQGPPDLGDVEEDVIGACDGNESLAALWMASLQRPHQWMFIDDTPYGSNGDGFQTPGVGRLIISKVPINNWKRKDAPATGYSAEAWPAEEWNTVGPRYYQKGVSGRRILCAAPHTIEIPDGYGGLASFWWGITADGEFVFSRSREQGDGTFSQFVTHPNPYVLGMSPFLTAIVAKGTLTRVGNSWRFAILDQVDVYVHPRPSSLPDSLKLGDFPPFVALVGKNLPEPTNFTESKLYKVSARLHAAVDRTGEHDETGYGKVRWRDLKDVALPAFNRQAGVGIVFQRTGQRVTVPLWIKGRLEEATLVFDGGWRRTDIPTGLELYEAAFLLRAGATFDVEGNARPGVPWTKDDALATLGVTSVDQLKTEMPELSHTFAMESLSSATPALFNAEMNLRAYHTSSPDAYSRFWTAQGRWNHRGRVILAMHFLTNGVLEGDVCDKLGLNS